MTIKSNSTVSYMGYHYEILDSHRVLLFDPGKLGINCDSASTSNYKGYDCQYAIEHGDLFLVGFFMAGTEVARDIAYLHFMTIGRDNCKVAIKMTEHENTRAFDLMIRSDQFYRQCTDLNIQNAFLIAKDRRYSRQLTAARDDLPWNYKTVHLVKTKNNRISSVENYSNEFYQFLRLFTSDGILQERYRILASEFLTENLGVTFDRYFNILD